MITREQLGKEVKLEGTIKKVSMPYIVLESIKFECKRCGSILSVIQSEEKIKEPSRCPCGNSSQFQIISKELRDQQDFMISLNGKEEIKVYLASKELMEKFSKLRNSRFIVTGKLTEEFKKKSVKGILVVYATEMKGGQN